MHLFTVSNPKAAEYQSSVDEITHQLFFVVVIHTNDLLMEKRAQDLVEKK